MNRKRNWGIAAMLAVGLTASACGGAGSSGSSGDESGAGVTASTIRIGGVGQMTDYAGLDVGFKARVERTNREGGINGRKIEFTGVQDDKGDATTNSALVRQLVQKDNVLAVAPVTSAAFLPQSADFLKQQKTPFVSWGILPSSCDNPYGFGFNGCLVGDKTISTGILAPIYKTTGKPADETTFGFLSNDNATGRAGNPQYARAVQNLGGKVVYDKANLPGVGKTTDYAPYAQTVLEANPDVLVLGTDFTSTVGMSVALRAAGFKGKQMSFVTYSPGLLEAQKETAAALEGRYVNIQIPPGEGASAAVKMIATDLSASGAAPNISFGVSLGYWQADVLIEMIKNVGPDLTRENLAKKTNAGFTYKSSLAGGIGDLTFPEAHTNSVPCSALVQVKNGAYNSVIPFDCYDLIPAEK